MNNIISMVIGSWGSYNECNERALGSKWLNFDDYDDWDAIKEELKKEGFKLNGIDEELFVQDIEGMPENSENWDYVHPKDIFELIKSSGVLDDEYKYDLMQAYCEAASFDEWAERVRFHEDDWDSDLILYRNRDMEDVAYELMHEIYEIPDCLENYIDYSRFAQDLSFDGYTETSKGVLQVI